MGRDPSDAATQSSSELPVTTNHGPTIAHAPPIDATAKSQAQKMTDQHLRLGGFRNAVIGVIPNSMNIGVSRADGPSARSNALPGPSQPPQQQQWPQQILHRQILVAEPQTVPIWSGSMNWSGHGSNGGKKHVRMYVVATSANASECRVDTWPQALYLMPTRESGDLQAWLKRHQPALCAFQIQLKTSEPKMNEYNYHSLVKLLVLKKLYARAAWTAPSGGQTGSILIFPVSGVGLAGAIFPHTDLPELSKPSAQQPKPMGMQPNPMAHMVPTEIPSDIPPQLTTSLCQISRDQRPMVLAHLVAPHRHQQQQQQRPTTPTAFESTQTTASTSGVSVKRQREDESLLAGMGAPSGSGVASEPSLPKRVKMEWEAQPSEELIKKEVVENIKLEEDASNFLTQMPVWHRKEKGRRG